MGPAILARALDGVPYAVKIHGSALEYTVKPHYQRFAPYASEGLVPARTVLVGSRHTAESLWAAMPLEGLVERTRLGPPGVEVHTFQMREPAEALEGFDALVRWLDSAQRTGFDGAAAEALDNLCAPDRERPPSGEELAVVRSGFDPYGIDVDAPQALAALDPSAQPVVAFVGKLIVSKGADLLLAAWPLVLTRHPDARLVVVGFGTYREGLEVLLRGLERADERLLTHVIAAAVVSRAGRAISSPSCGHSSRASAAGTSATSPPPARCARASSSPGGSSTASSRGCSGRSGSRRPKRVPGGVWDGRRRGGGSSPSRVLRSLGARRGRGDPLRAALHAGSPAAHLRARHALGGRDRRGAERLARARSRRSRERPPPSRPDGARPLWLGAGGGEGDRGRAGQARVARAARRARRADRRPV